MKGLSTLKNNKAHICGCHLWDNEKEEYNFPFINSYLPNAQITVVNFAFRKQGMIVAKNNPQKISNIEDLCRNDVSFINRQEGSGTRVLLDNYLSKLNISASSINGYRRKCNTHFDVGINVLTGNADVGIGIEAIAQCFNLDFIPLKEERYDLLVQKRYFFNKEVNRLS